MTFQICKATMLVYKCHAIAISTFLIVDCLYSCKVVKEFLVFCVYVSCIVRDIATMSFGGVEPPTLELETIQVKLDHYIFKIKYFLKN